MALPAALFPASIFGGNEQDPANDGAADPKKFQAGDYNKLATEIVELQAQLRDGAILAVKNDSGGIISKGEVIRITGFDPVTDLPRVQLAVASASTTLGDGVAIQTIADGSSGNMAKHLIVKNLNTDALGAAGTDLFLSASTPGAVTATASANAQLVGLVTRQSLTVGSIYFDVTLPAAPHAFGGSAHTPSTLAEVNALISDANVDDDGDPRDPNAHPFAGSEHTTSLLAAVNSKISDATLDDASAARTPVSHAFAGTEHSASLLAAVNSKISDAILDDISGTRTPSSHAFAGAEHAASLLAAVNSKISDATLDDASATRTPTAHKTSHEDGGSDELTVEGLAAVSIDTTKVFAPDGAGGVSVVTPPTGLHASDHSESGIDEVTVENLATGSNDVSQALRPDGAGGVAFSDVGHADLTGVGIDDHHARDHELSHEDGGSDELPVASLSEAAAPGNDVSQALRPDGAGGVAFSDVGHADLTGVGIDNHHARDHAASHSENATDEVFADNLGAISTDGALRLAPDGTGGLLFKATGGRYLSTIGSPHTTASAAAGGGTVSENITGFGGRANHIIRLRVTPSAAISSYDVELFRDDTFGGTSFYLAAGITLGLTPFEDFLISVPDDDNTGEFHIRITNDDGALASTFDVEFEVSTVEA